ncbi:MAG TPA: glycerophosphodiester phosphodiesterase [Solirubrobacteraceae bacterium]|nr:glycerophosphodiester phosphodiesterase [Solirubrobacteraceae bacterium]
MRTSWVRLAAAVAVVAILGPPAAAAAHEKKPLVIGHRGAAGYLPDHTLQGYELAIDMGADYIEPDLVATKDGHLIARHEPNMIATTDVANRPKFADRIDTREVDGASETGFFASDFTLAEIKQLRAVQPLPERSQRYNGKFKIPTLEEILDLVERKERELHRTIGVYPETKHPTYHQRLGLPLEGRLVAALKRHRLDRKNSPVFIQSFEQSNLKQLNHMTPVRLVQLVDANDVNPDGTLDYTAPFDRPYDWTASGDPRLLARTFGFFATDAGLREIATYADGIGPWKRYIVSSKVADLNGDGTIGDENHDGNVDEADRQALPPTDLIRRAHEHGLLIHTWTFRNESKRLLSDYADRAVDEYLQFYELGIDGVFSDFADTALTARRLFKLGN